MIKAFKKLFSIVSRLIPDLIYLKLEYYYRTGQKLNLDNPVLFNEKIQWLKLYNRHPEYSKMADKYEVRKHVVQTIGEKHLIPLYGVWDKFDDIPFDSLPDQFILKSNHDSGGTLICKNKQSFDFTKARAIYRKRLARNYYWQHRQWVYKDIQPRITAEKLMFEEPGMKLNDYKIFCFNGEPKIVQVDFYIDSDKKTNFYSPEWEYLPFSQKYPTVPNIEMPKPNSINLMMDFAKKLSNGIPHVRVDLYLIIDKIYFGELTFYNWAGYERFEPFEWDRLLGDWITLPKNEI